MEKSKTKIGTMKTIANNIYFLKIIFKICPLKVILTFLNTLLGFGSWVFFSVIFIQYIFSSGINKHSFPRIIIFMAGYMVAFLAFNLFHSWYGQRNMNINNQKIEYELNKMLFEKAVNVDVSCYESPEFYDQYTRALQQAKEKAFSVVDDLSVIVSVTLSCIYITSVMISLDKIISIFVISPLIGKFILGPIRNDYTYRANLEKTPYQRRMDYVNRVVYLKDYAKDIRLSHVFSLLKKTYDEGYDGTVKTIKKYQKPLVAIRYVTNVLMFPIAFQASWLYAAYLAMIKKSIDMGGFLVLAGSITSVSNMFFNLLDAILQTFENGLYIENFKTFLNYRPKIDEQQDGLPVPEKIETIEFRNVYFSYEESQSPVLADINIKISAGEKIAVVGHNGAGKTTFIKLLMRFYDPTAGEILLNGINIKTFNLKQYRTVIGAVFQDYKVFSMTVVENVLMKTPESDEERETAVNTLKKVGVFEKVETLKNIENTILTREFDNDGAVLSGGQVQKVAIARAYAKKSGIVILDEPSSALDPVAEHKMYETMLNIYNDEDTGEKRILIFISHRLSSATLSDRVYLFENGKIEEQGTHGELMELDGIYADMFNKQAENYLEEVNIDE